MKNFEKYNLQELIDIIKNSCQNIYKQLGSGHNEKIYHKALKYELDCLYILNDIERHVNVTYLDSIGNVHNLESIRIDMYIFGKEYDIILELKAISSVLSEKENEQLQKYFRELKKEGKNIKTGIIINFPQPSNKESKNEIEFKIFENE